MYILRLLAILGLVFLGIVSQLLPHPPNFTLISSIALLGTSYLLNRQHLFAVIIAIMLVNDCVFGFHSTMPFVYFSLGLTVLLGDHFKRKLSLPFLPIACTLNSLIFFLITNFGVWTTTTLYPNNLTGLGLCYLAAIPFLMNNLVADIVYGIMFYCIANILFNENLMEKYAMPNT